MSEPGFEYMTVPQFIKRVKNDFPEEARRKLVARLFTKLQHEVYVAHVNGRISSDDTTLVYQLLQGDGFWEYGDPRTNKWAQPGFGPAMLGLLCRVMSKYELKVNMP